MTDEQINAAIADACGWGQKPVVNTDGKGSVWVTNCPNYCTDLNAMHEAEETIEDRNKYINNLAFVAEPFDGNQLDCDWFFMRATARQRAEAFLRTLGKWEEGE
jgi:hypothetical protein